MPDKTMTEDMGGMVAETLNHLKGREFECYGCDKKFTLGSFLGYLHEGGIPDKEGNHWWVYWVCPKCHYQWAWHKIVRKM